MIVDINPITASFKHGVANAVQIDLIQDNLVDQATFFWHVGNNVPSGATKLFNGAIGISGTITINGTEYANWDGSNAQAKTIILGKLILVAKP